MRAVHTLATWMKVLAVGAAVAILALAVMGVVVYKDEQEEDRRDAELLVERQVEACYNYNQDQTNDRHTAIEGLKEFAITFLDVTEDEANLRLASPEGQHFVAFINDQNPYRQCSVKCVQAHITPGAAKCGPALNEQGDPP